MKMKKITLSLAGALAAVAFAPNASAIPAFARQVGMACSACHYQHFPALNAFGRSFKQSGYTMVGAQEKIEGDDISLPTTLNAALVGQMNYNKASGQTGLAPSAPGAKVVNDGTLQIPQAVSLFFGGRAGEHVGFEAEYQISGGGTGAVASSLIRLKVPFVYDMSGLKVGVIPYSTNLGAADSFELLNTGSVAVHAFNQSAMTVTSAQQYLATGGNATGVAFVASNENFFANFSKWGQNTGTGVASSTSNYLRAAWTPSDLISGFDTAIGFQSWSGSSAAAAALTANDTKATAIDGQLMGDVKGMPLLVTASYAVAPKSSVGTLVTNLYNASTTNDKKSFNIGAELGVIPGKATVQFALRNASSGAVVPGTAGGNATDNAYMLGATYNIALNVRGELTYVKNSGDLYNTAGLAGVNNSTTTLDLVFGF